MVKVFFSSIANHDSKMNQSFDCGLRVQGWGWQKRYSRPPLPPHLLPLTSPRKCDWLIALVQTLVCNIIDDNHNWDHSKMTVVIARVIRSCLEQTQQELMLFRGCLRHIYSVKIYSRTSRKRLPKMRRLSVSLFLKAACARNACIAYRKLRYWNPGNLTVASPEILGSREAPSSTL